MKWIGTFIAASCSLSAWANVEHFVRYQYQDQVSYGQLKGETITPIKGGLFAQHSLSDKTVALADVEILLPTQPEKVFAVGMNFRSHAASHPDLPPPMFLKLPSSLVLSGQPVHAPFDARNVHFEGELVLVIGKTLHKADQEEAEAGIFGVTVGNDLTERSWQGSDLQWLRAKASDGFGPIGKTIARGVDYNDVELTTRLNGSIVQQENTTFMIHSPKKVVSYLSHYFTLKPGDLIFMGTPGKTKALKDGDMISVSIKGVGEVTNTIYF
ncbi:fumarylacetoacetate hydrolase family protein [Vibrio sp. D404a]|uniref:fumarylacetoacetate hydrolase family protein n=1 Tax=unclassified Vibrio TaxID=2614977 RepID=UPI002552139B|nr:MULTISPECIES: fumarylacetoacetate hydrolase family protein [unclassified Vibrio]MDK9738534.1 fumarylacetoacetate hydrolase family protein [Vibrio sp. D404a]MDK9796102.1 fumarylacetoacetate hydrolase family protein [Vibrio sp. D449a]